MTAEEIVREIYGNNYTIDDLKRIEKAVVEEQEHWRKNQFKKGIERNYLRSKRMLRLNPHDDFSKGFSEALEGVQVLNDSGKVKIPEYVAKYLEWMRDVNQFKEPYIILNSVMSGMCAGTDVEKEGSQTAHWLEDRPKNIKTFVEACTNGYEACIHVKEDPKYRIKLPGLAGSNGQQYISKSADGKLFACARRDYLQQEFTNDELKQLPNWVQQLELEEVEDD